MKVSRNTAWRSAPSLGRGLPTSLIALLALLGAGQAAVADSSDERLASYYDRHMAIVGGTAFGWSGNDRPTAMIADAVQVGVGKDAYYALRKDGTLLTWSGSPANAAMLMREVVSFAAGNSGWLAINRGGSLWQGAGREPPRKLAEKVIAAAVGDGADYYIKQGGDLYVRGAANRGQYGDGRSSPSSDFVKTAAQAVVVRAHTGHALYLDKSGQVFGTGGKVQSWTPILSGVKGVAAGATHAAAILDDGSLWVWGSGFAAEPTRVAESIVTVAAGSGTTIALSADGKLWAWDGGRGPRPIALGH